MPEISEWSFLGTMFVSIYSCTSNYNINMNWLASETYILDVSDSFYWNWYDILKEVKEMGEIRLIFLKILNIWG